MPIFTEICLSFCVSALHLPGWIPDHTCHFQTSFYEKYVYRIRFCWWAAEERGLLGSYDHIEQANITNIEGNRLKDYVMMLNLDMCFHEDFLIIS